LPNLDVSRPEHSNSTSDNQTTITQLEQNPALVEIDNLQLTLNQFKHNPRQLTEEQLESLKSNFNNISNVFRNPASIPPSTNSFPQRRQKKSIYNYYQLSSII
jgi:hypothetical protein